MTQPLNIKVDSGQARADLDALAKSLDAAGAAAGRMSTGLSAGMGKADSAIKGSMGNMEKFAQVAATLNKIKIDSSGTKAIAEFGKVLGQVARTKEIETSKMASWSKFIELGAQSSRLKMDGGAAAGLLTFSKAMDTASRARAIDPAKMASWAKFIELGARSSQLRMGSGSMVAFNMFAQAMDNVSKARAISPAKLKSWVDFIEVAARSQRLKFDPAVSASLTAFGNAMANLKMPGKANIDRLEKMFAVLGNAKRIPGAEAIARDLDAVAAAAGRASMALERLPARLKSMGSGGGGAGLNNMARQMNEAGAGAVRSGGSFDKFAAGAEKAGKSSYTLGERLRGLNHRFSLGYHASTLFTTAFASFTLGGMIRGIYDASVGLMKLEKSMLFATRSVEGGHKATQNFISTTYEMGASLEATSDAYGRFVISSTAAGLNISQSNDIFKNTLQTLQIVGASAEQTGYAFYGLTQMIQKGKVSSEEFNRQVGEQIPGNATAGAAAMSQLLGRRVEIAEFFEMMRKGQIMSATFIPAWAAELKKMFGPMQALVQNRPDIAVNRLKTAMTTFQQEVGKSSFITELGVQLNRLAGYFMHMENGVWQLKPAIKDLAHQLGKNLANMVRLAGDAAMWLAENMDTVLTVAKGLAALVVGTTIAGWAKQAFSAATGFAKMSISMGNNVRLFVGLKTASERAAAAEVKNAATRIAAAEAETAAYAARNAAAGGAVASGIRGAGMDAVQAARSSAGHAPRVVSGDINRAANFASVGQTTTDAFARRPAKVLEANPEARPGFGRRIPKAAAAADIAAMVPAVSSVDKIAPAASKGAMAMRGLSMAFSGAAAAAGIYGLAVMATAGALLVLSDKQTKLGGETLQFKDIMNGALDVIGNKASAAFGKASKSGEGFKGFLEDFGPVIEATVLALAWMGELVVDTFMAAVNSVSALINIIAAGVHAVDAGIKWISGDKKGSAEAMGRARDDTAKSGRDIGNIGSDWSDNLDFEGRKGAQRAASLAARTERQRADNANAADNAAQEAARILQEQAAAAAAQREAAAMQVDAARMMQEAMRPPTPGGLMARIVALMDGSYASAHPVAGSSAAGPAAPDPLTTPGTRMQQRLTDGRVIEGRTPREMAAAALAAGMTEEAATRLAVEFVKNSPDFASMRGASSSAVAAAAGVGGAAPAAGRYATGGSGNAFVSTASRFIGQNETTNRGSIRDFLQQGGVNVDPKMTAWCAAFVNAVLKTNGVQGTSSNLARSFTNYGEAVGQGQERQGDIAVFRRGNSETQGHVGFFQGYDENGNVRIVGGNQGRDGRVSETTMNRRDLLAIRRAPGATAGNAAAGMATNPDGTPVRGASDIQEDANAAMNDYKSLQALLAMPDPLSQVLAQEATKLETLRDVIDREEARVGKGMITMFNPELAAAIAKSFEKISEAIGDAANPITKMNREANQAMDIQDLLNKGLESEAAWREQTNALTAQGYDLAAMEDEAAWLETINRLNAEGRNIKVQTLSEARAEFEASRQRQKNIASEIALIQARNEITVRSIGRQGGRQQADLAALIDSSSSTGTYAQKLANLSAEALANYREIARLREEDVRSEETDRVRVDIVELVDSAGLTASASAARDDYKSILEDITGESGRTLAQLETFATASEKTLAKGFSKLREELENQPGFAKWADSLDPLEKRMEDIKGQFMDGLSDGITDAIMGEDVDWNAMWKNIRKAQVKAGVDAALASVSNFLSGRKPGELTLTPEAQATYDAAKTWEASAVTNRDATEGAANRLIDAAGALEGAAAAMRGEAPVAADAGDEYFMNGGRAAGLTAPTSMTPTADAYDEWFAAGGSASGRPMPTTPTMADAGDEFFLNRASAAATAPAPFDVSSIVSNILASVGIGGAAPTGGRAPITGSALPPVDAVRAIMPAPSATVGIQRDERNIGQMVGEAILGGSIGGYETDQRMTTASAASTAVTAGPVASFVAGEDAGLTSAAESVYNAGAALTAVPASFGELSVQFGAVVTKFGEVVEAFGAAVAQMGQGGGGGNPLQALTGGGGGGMPSLPSGFGGDPIPSDLIGLFADGGYVSGKGGPTSDSINARLSNGEFVINAQATAGNRGLLEAINEGKAFASGGYVDGLPGFAGGGWFSGVRNSATQFGSRFTPSNMKNHFFGEGSENMSARDMGSRAFSGTFGKGQDGKYNGAGAGFGQMFGKGNSMETRLSGGMNILNTIGTLAEMFGKKDKVEADPKAVQGVIGEHRAVTVDATQIAAHENPIAMAINMVANMATGGQWDKARALGEMAYGSAKSIGRAFAEGGYVSSGGASGMDWSSAPHYAEGTANTSGGMPAVVHPNEAIIPLNGGRKVPVDVSGMASDRSISNNVTSNITVIAPNPDAFRKSQGSIQRQQNRDSRRAANRNLTP